jgi:hypothetical protein
VYGSPINYGHLSLSKALTIIGPGYYLNENPETQAYPATASANTITFNNFSSGSLLTGLWTDHINVNTDSITLKRLRIHSGYHEGSINLSQYVDVVTIQQ